MQSFASVVIRALLIAVAFGSAGIMANLAADNSLPWVYAPPKDIKLAGAVVTFIDEREALKFLDDPETVFVDSRNCDDYAKNHVKGAVCLPPDDVEQRFPSVEPLMAPENRLILYCYGPDCDMAERVATFLAQLGYKNMMIMSSGFPAWERANFPVEGRKKKDTAVEDPEDNLREDEIAETELASRRLCKCLDACKVAFERSHGPILGLNERS